MCNYFPGVAELGFIQTKHIERDDPTLEGSEILGWVLAWELGTQNTKLKISGNRVEDMQSFIMIQVQF